MNISQDVAKRMNLILVVISMVAAAQAMRLDESKSSLERRRRDAAVLVDGDVSAETGGPTPTNNSEIRCEPFEPCKYAKTTVKDSMVQYKLIDSWCKCSPDEVCKFAMKDYARKLHIYHCRSPDDSDEIARVGMGDSMVA